MSFARYEKEITSTVSSQMETEGLEAIQSFVIYHKSCAKWSVGSTIQINLFGANTVSRSPNILITPEDVVFWSQLTFPIIYRCHMYQCVFLPLTQSMRNCHRHLSSLHPSRILLVQLLWGSTSHLPSLGSRGHVQPSIKRSASNDYWEVNWVAYLCVNCQCVWICVVVCITFLVITRILSNSGTGV